MLDLKKNKNIIIIVTCIFIVAFAIIIVAIFSKNEEVAEVVQDTTIGTSATAQTTTVTTVTTTKATTTLTTVTTTEETTTETSKPEWSYTPSIKKETVINKNKSNSDCKGWIYIKNSAIDYPIMQSDDNSYYVYHSSTGAESGHGSIMLDYECTIGKTNNILLYGHNMGDGSMFHQVKSYKDESWWLDHQYVEVANLEKIYVYQIFSIDVLYGLSDASFTYWLEPNKSLADEDTYNSFVNNVIAKRYTSIGITSPSYPTGILTLQTCNSAANDGMRCVAFGKLVGIFDLK